MSCQLVIVFYQLVKMLHHAICLALSLLSQQPFSPKIPLSNRI